MSTGSPFSRLARLVAAAALTMTVATALATTSATPAEAAQTAVKPQPGSAFCGYDDILVSTPAMTSDPQTVPAGVAWVDTAQQVAWRANLTQWNGSQWVTIRWGDWFTGRVGVMYDQTGYSETSWTTLSGESLSGLPGFWDLPSGSFSAPIYYMVWYQYYWYADEYRNARYDSSWAASHEENRGAGEGTAFYDTTYYSNCKYPGPNWLVNRT